MLNSAQPLWLISFAQCTIFSPRLCHSRNRTTINSFSPGKFRVYKSLAIFINIFIGNLSLYNNKRSKNDIVNIEFCFINLFGLKLQLCCPNVHCDIYLPKWRVDLTSNSRVIIRIVDSFLPKKLVGKTKNKQAPRQHHKVPSSQLSNPAGKCHKCCTLLYTGLIYNGFV